MTTPDQQRQLDAKTLEMIELRGGSFMRSLAICYSHADQDNKAKIKKTWSSDWARYERMVLRKEQA